MENAHEKLPHIGRLARYPYFAMMAEGHQRLLDAGFEALDASYSIIFQFIGDGSRMTDLASKGQTTKQNIKYLVDQLEEKGYVKRRQDANDKRAHIYYLTDKGHKYRNAGLKINNDIEEEWAAELGKKNMVTLKKLLFHLAGIIERKRKKLGS